MQSQPWKLIGLLLILTACQGQETVQISGAVAHPGTYAYRANWKPADYISAAGGYLEETDLAQVALVRGMKDSLVNETQHGQVAWWALEDAPEVAPGDLIMAPLKTYAIRLDTVRRVQNWQFEWQEHIYRIERGKFVPGWTQRGLMAAVILGTGQVVEKTSGDVVGPFQYLYLTMHPEQYAKHLPEPGERIVDRETLEDAVALHNFLFEESSYRSGNRTQLPPNGYLHAQAGVWLTPKNPAFPGRGLRKRHYKDGRIWTTFPDGRQRTRHPNGRVVMQYPNKTQEVRFPDGTMRFEDISGSIKTQHADGRTTLKDTDGNLQTIFPDGTEEWELISGNRMTLFPDGRRVHQFASGTKRTVHPDGTERTLFTDGTRHILHPSGKVEIHVPGGKREIRYPDGRVFVTTPKGHEVVVHKDGRQFTRMIDGTTIEQFSDGRKIQKRPSGETLEILANRTRRTRYPDGPEVVRRPDDVRVATLTDGTIIEQHPDGRQVQTDTSGVRLELLSADHMVITDRAGNRFEALPGGIVHKQYADPYQYRGLMRRDLIRLDRTPDRISPKIEAILNGSVQEAVQKLSLTVFALPEGDVLDMPATLENGHFTGN